MNARLWNKGQTQPITLILITTLLISLLSAAYIWGVPIIQKRTTLSDFNSGANFLDALNERIIGVSNAGGRQSLEVPAGSLRVVPYDAIDPDNNSVILEIIADQPMLVLGQEVPLRTGSLVEIGTFGINEPRIITIKEERLTSQYKITFRMHYRELDSVGVQRKGFKIALKTAGTGAGTEKVTASFDRNIVQPSAAYNGGDLTLSLVNVDIV